MTSAIIVAAGQGTRMGRAIDKTVPESRRPTGGVPHLARFKRPPRASTKSFWSCANVLRPAFAELADKFQFGKPYRLVVGGNERMDSVWNAWSSGSSH